MKRFWISVVLVSVCVTGAAFAQGDAWQTTMEKARQAASEGNQQAAVTHYQQAMGIAEQDAANPDRVKTIVQELSELYANGKAITPEEAEWYYTWVLRVQEQAMGPDHLQLADTLTQLVETKITLQRYAQAQPLQERLVEIYSRTLGERSSEWYAARERLADIYIYQEQYPQAEALLTDLLTDNTITAVSIDLSNARYSLLYLYEKQKKFAEAELLLKRLQSQFNNVGDAVSHAVISSRLARVYNLQGRTQDAEPLLLKAMPVLKPLKDHEEDYSATLLEMGKVRISQKRYKEAEPMLKEALDIYEVNPTPGDSQWWELLTTLAQVYQKTAQVDKANTLEAKAREVKEQANVSN